MEILQSLKEPFLEALEAHTTMYKLIGFGTDESPMWFQFRGMTEDNQNLIFHSSQRYEIRFELPCTKEQIEYIRYHYSDTYDYFKSIKYEYLRTNHNTVFQELK